MWAGLHPTHGSGEEHRKRYSHVFLKGACAGNCRPRRLVSAPVFIPYCSKNRRKTLIHVKIVEKNLIHVRFQGDPHPSVSRLSSNKVLISLRNLASTSATIKHSEIMLQGGLVRIACNCVEINSAAGENFVIWGVFLCLRCS